METAPSTVFVLVYESPEMEELSIHYSSINSNVRMTFQDCYNPNTNIRSMSAMSIASATHEGA